MKVAILIPARFESSRYPGKPLVALAGASGGRRTLIERSHEAASRVGGAASVHVVTDDDRIAAAVAAFGGQVIMTSTACRNGTERCAEALDRLDGPDLVVNLQGDALLTPPRFVEALIERMASDPEAEVATPAIRLRQAELDQLRAEEAAGRVGGTSVVVDDFGHALYFSKRLIPYLPARANSAGLTPLRLHVGVYAYRPAGLRSYAMRDPSELEMLEGLEQLRFLASGRKVAVVEVEPPPFALRELNNPEDVAPIEQALREAGIE